MGQATPQIASRNLGPQYQQSTNAYNNLGNIGNISGSNTPLANRISSELTNFFGNAGGVADQLKSFYGAGPSLAQQQLVSQTGRDIQKRGEEAIGSLRENPYTSGARSGANLLGQFFAPMETGLYTQQAQDAQNRAAMGLSAAGQMMGIPSMYAQMLAPEQFKTQNQFGYDQLNTNINMQNIANQLAKAGGLGNLAQLFTGSQEMYMQPDFMSQFLQALLGGLAQGAGAAGKAAIPTVI